MGKLGCVLSLLEKLARLAVVVMPHAVCVCVSLYQLIRALKLGEAVKKEAIKSAIVATIDCCGIQCPPSKMSLLQSRMCLTFCGSEESKSPNINLSIGTPTGKHLPLLVYRCTVKCDNGSLMSYKFLDALLRHNIIHDD